MNNKPEIIEGSLFVDDRGFVSSVNNMDMSNIKRFYIVENYENKFVRAWHGHKNEEKYAYVLNGSVLFKVILLDELQNKNKDSYKKIISATLSSRSPGILRIPAGYANGFMNLEKDTKVIFFSTSTLDESKNDDYRFDWNILGENIWNIKQR